jgi:hypothetical protein
MLTKHSSATLFSLSLSAYVSCAWPRVLVRDRLRWPPIAWLREGSLSESL